MKPELEFGNDMRRGFQLTRSFRELYREALIFHLIPHTKKEMKAFSGRLAGALFAGKAFNSNPLDGTLVLGNHLLNVYQKLYPYAEPIEHPLGQSSLNGVSVSDALLISHGRIAIVCEATVSNDESYFLRKYSGFITTQKEFPELFGNAGLIFITVKDPILPDVVKKDKNVSLIELPFTGKQFSGYVNRIYREYRPSRNSATLAEIQKRIQQQVLRAESNKSGLTIDGNGQFTEEYDRYLVTVRGIKAMSLNGKSG